MIENKTIRLADKEASVDGLAEAIGVDKKIIQDLPITYGDIASMHEEASKLRRKQLRHKLFTAFGVAASAVSLYFTNSPETFGVIATFSAATSSLFALHHGLRWWGKSGENGIHDIRSYVLTQEFPDRHIFAESVSSMAEQRYVGDSRGISQSSSRNNGNTQASYGASIAMGSAGNFPTANM